MSDFDREAEREKLREQFAEEREDRETTERMSELLLQGATMTNRHCDTCGDPIFRHEGQEFCPTCSAQANGQQAQAQQVEGQQAAGQPETGQQETAQRGQPADAQQEQPTEHTTQEPARQQAAPEQQSESPAEQASTPVEPEQVNTAAGGQQRRQAGTDAGDLSEAHGALVRTVTRLSREAEASDDLGRTREYLAGAKEAAEALRAVRQAER